MYKMRYMTSCRNNKRRNLVRKRYPFRNKGGEQSVKAQGKFWLVNKKVIRLNLEKTRSLQKFVSRKATHLKTQKS
jgi:hypothetical protein